MTDAERFMAALREDAGRDHPVRGIAHELMIAASRARSK